MSCSLTGTVPLGAALLAVAAGAFVLLRPEAGALKINPEFEPAKKALVALDTPAAPNS